MGKLEFIGLRKARRGEVVSASSCEVNNTGLDGDHYTKEDGRRAVTLISKEGLEEVAKRLSRDHVNSDLTRRNLLISGISFADMIGKRIKIGDEVVLEITGKCHPCSRMEENLGEGGLKAMAGHAGLTASVEVHGTIGVGYEVIELK